MNRPASKLDASRRGGIGGTGDGEGAGSQFRTSKFCIQTVEFRLVNGAGEGEQLKVNLLDLKHANGALR